MTDDLVAFLRARLDEDEQVARAAADGDSGSWFVRGDLEVFRAESRNLPGMEPYHRAVVPGAVPAQLHHIARHDPARVLAEVDAKRRLVDECAEVLARDDWEYTDAPELAEVTLLMLALPYREHPDYQLAWALET